MRTEVVNRAHIAIAGLMVGSIVLSACRAREPFAELQPGPIQHVELPPDQVERISALQKIFSDHVLSSFELETLSVEDAKALLALYDLPAAPIIVAPPQRREPIQIHQPP